MYARLTLLEIDTVRRASTDGAPAVPRATSRRDSATSPVIAACSSRRPPRGRAHSCRCGRPKHRLRSKENTFYAEAISRFVTLFRRRPDASATRSCDARRARRARWPEIVMRTMFGVPVATLAIVAARHARRAGRHRPWRRSRSRNIVFFRLGIRNIGVGAAGRAC